MLGLVCLKMSSHSNPGPDGFSPRFYKTWDTVGSDFLDLAKALHNLEADLRCINQVYIALLPKENAVTAGGFRPISLQNCTMKLITNALTTRLQGFITQLVDFNQAGFIQGWNISYYFLYAAMLVQYCHKRKIPIAQYSPQTGFPQGVRYCPCNC